MSEQQVNHAERAHARFSASGSERWLSCPASIKAEIPYPNTSSVFAEEGTLAHELADTALQAGKRAALIPLNAVKRGIQAAAFQIQGKGAVRFRLLFFRKMNLSKTKRLHPGLHQLKDVVDTVGGRAQGGEDFDLLVRRHGWQSRGSGWRGSR